MIKYKTTLLKLILLTVVLGLGFFFHIGQAQAGTNWYVTTKPCTWVNNSVAMYNPDADSCTGGAATAFNSIENALAYASVVPGDTVLVADGIYAAMTNQGTYYTSAFIRKGGTAGNVLTIKSKNKYGAHFQCSEKAVNREGIAFNTDVSYVNLEDFELSNCRYMVVLNNNNDHITIHGNKIHNVVTGINGGKYSDYEVVENNVIYDFGLGGDNQHHAIYLRGIDGVVQNNVVYNNLGLGWSVHVGAYCAAGSGNCLPFEKPSGTWKFINNTLEGTNNTTDTCVIFYSSTFSTVILDNNICSGASSGLVSVSGDVNAWGPTWEAKNNLIESSAAICQTGTAGKCDLCDGVRCVNNKTNVNPGFIDGATHNYALANGSPAINAGLATYAPHKDISGTVRPQGVAPDIGAFEYSASIKEKIIYVDNGAQNCTDGATTYNPSTRDCGSGDYQLYLMIQRAIEQSPSGNTIKVAAGTYVENIAINKDLAIIGDGFKTTTIDGGGISSVVRVENNVKAELRGFSIVGGKTGFSGEPWHESGIFCMPESNLTITDNSIHAGTLYGINYAGGLIAPLVARNQIYGHERYGVAISNASPVILNNLVYDNGWAGIYSWNNYAQPEIRNNVIYRNRDGVGYYNNSAPIIENNIIVDNRDTGIGEDEENHGYSHNYNDVFNNKVNYNNAVAGVGALAIDPLFIDPNNGNFRLQTISEARNAGNPLSLFNDKNGTQNDMGLYGGPQAEVRLGDVNLDDKVNIKDIQVVIQVIVGTETDPDVVARVDANGDGKVNIKDIQEIIREIIKT